MLLLSDIFLLVFSRTSRIIWGLTQLKSPFNSLSEQPLLPHLSHQQGGKLKKGEGKVAKVCVGIN